MIDIAPEYLHEVKRLLGQHAPGVEVWAFGSRVSGRAKNHSDLDLVLINDEPLDWRTIEKLKDAFSESNLPFMVDVVDWHAMSAPFRKIIEEDCEIVQRAEERKV